MTEKNDTSRLNEKYIFRNIRQEEITQAAEIEKICFPPNEACSYAHMEKRVEKAPELFLVAEDRATGRDCRISQRACYGQRTSDG